MTNPTDVARIDVAQLGVLGELGDAGQGRVFRVTVPYVAQPVAYKEYSRAVAERVNWSAVEGLIRVYASADPATRAWLWQYTAWPTTMVTRLGDRTGILLPMAPPECTVPLTVGGVTRPTLLGLDHLLNPPAYMASTGLSVTLQHRVQLVRELAAILTWLHRNDIAVGDLSPRIVAVSLWPRASCFLLDADAVRRGGQTVLDQQQAPGWELPDGEELATRAGDSYKLALIALRVLASNRTTRDASLLPASLPELTALVTRTLAAEPAQRPSAPEWLAVLDRAVPLAAYIPPPPAWAAGTGFTPTVAAPAPAYAPTAYLPPIYGPTGSTPVVPIQPMPVPAPGLAVPVTGTPSPVPAPGLAVPVTEPPSPVSASGTPVGVPERAVPESALESVEAVSALPVPALESTVVESSSEPDAPGLEARGLEAPEPALETVAPESAAESATPDTAPGSAMPASVVTGSADDAPTVAPTSPADVPADGPTVDAGAPPVDRSGAGAGEDGTTVSSAPISAPSIVAAPSPISAPPPVWSPAPSTPPIVPTPVPSTPISAPPTVSPPPVWSTPISAPPTVSPPVWSTPIPPASPVTAPPMVPDATTIPRWSPPASSDYPDASPASGVPVAAVPAFADVTTSAVVQQPGWPASPAPWPVPAEPSRSRMWIAIVAAVVGVLVLGGGAYAIVTRLENNSVKTTPPVAAGSTPAPVLNTPTAPSTSDSPSAQPTETLPSPSPTVGMIDYSAVASTDPRALDVAELFDRYFSAINGRDYPAVLASYDPNSEIGKSDSAGIAQFEQGISTSTDTNIRLVALANGTGNISVQARVTFQSAQAAGLGPARNPNETCTNWDVTYSLTEPSPGAYLIFTGKVNANAPC